MIDNNDVYLIILVMAAIVYATRLGGYLIGLQLRHIRGIKPILEALPGCAFMAILAPAVRQGSLVEILAMSAVVGIMWRTDNVFVATVSGLIILLFGDVVLSYKIVGQTW